MANIVLILTGLFFLGMGLLALLNPAAVVRPFGMSLPKPESRAEVRAVYGGFGLAIAAMVGLAATHQDLRAGILLTVAAALGGMAFGRVVSGIVDRPKAFYPNWFYFLVEVIAAAALWWAAQ